MGKVIGEGRFGAAHPKPDDLKEEKHPVPVNEDTDHSSTIMSDATLRHVETLYNEGVADLQDFPELLRCTEQASAVAHFLLGLRGQISEHAINEGRKIVSGYTVEELAQALDQSTEFTWRKKPGFYKALCLEIRDRIRKVVEQYKQEEE